MTYPFFHPKMKAKFSPSIFVLSIFLAVSACSSNDDAKDNTETPIETRETLNGEGVYNDSNARIVENLNRGLIAVKSEDGILLSWRLLGTEYDTNIAFDVYKNGKKINDKPITDSTNFLDKDATFTNDIEYKVQAIVNGNQQLALSKAALLLKDGYLNIPLQAVDGEYYIHHAWPGDVDGDGEYEFIVSRLPRSNSATLPSFIEAYKLDGTFLWRVNMGVNSYQKQDGIAANDGAAAAISGFGATAGYRNDDLVTVYDLDSDGKAEVLVRTATGTTFADGTVISEESAGVVNQYISVIDGQSGKEKTRTAVPDDLKELGPVGGHFAIAYLDGKKPSLITKLVARAPGKNGSGFQWYMTAWNYENGQLTRRWHWNAPTNEATRLEYRFHQMRVVDIDQDGKDEIIDGNYVINDDGNLLYIIDEAIHGDRFHIGDFDPNRPGLEGYAIQQTEVGKWTKFPWFYYDAATGARLITGKHPFENPDKSNKEHERLWDVPRGTVADIDPRYDGFEFWASMSEPDLPGAGLFNVNGTKISSTIPSTTNFRIYWDADEGDELLDGSRIWKWDYINSKDNLIFQIPNVVETPRVAQPFYGDILGDWREEILIETNDYQNLRLYSTPIKTDKRHYTLAHNPEYRLGFTTKGYVQSNHLDYYFGWNMPTTPKPKIRVLNK